MRKKRDVFEMNGAEERSRDRQGTDERSRPMSIDRDSAGSMNIDYSLHLIIAGGLLAQLLGPIAALQAAEYIAKMSIRSRRD